MSAPEVPGPRLGPLVGVRIVFLAALGPIPFATMLLADMGADVVRIDRVGPAGDLTGLSLSDDPRTRGHRGIGVDLKQPAGLALVHDLLRGADVFLEGMRPGVAERLGLGPDDVQERNPRLVYGRMTGWGQSGPLALRAGHDINYLSMAGALHPLGSAAEPPTVPLNLVADFGGGGTYLALGVLAALFDRARTGMGQVVDCAMVDGVASLTAMFHGMLATGAWSDERGVNIFDGAAHYYRTYTTSDGRYLAVGALEPQFYGALLRGLELDAADWPQNDRSRWPEQSRQLAALFATRTREEWTATFAGTDACVTPVLTMTEAAHHPDLAARGTFIARDGLTQPAPAPRLSASAPLGAAVRSARFSHTDEVAAELMYSLEHIAALRADGVIA